MCYGKADFSACITLVFSVTWSFRNHSNVQIQCLKSIYSYYQCWKHLYLFKPWYSYLKFKRTCLFLNIVNVFFDKCNTFLPSKSINLFPKIHRIYTEYVWVVLHISDMVIQWHFCLHFRNFPLSEMNPDPRTSVWEAQFLLTDKLPLEAFDASR